MNKNCGIYKITSPTGRIYIGQSINIKSRWVSYSSPSGAKGQVGLQRSLIKYGIKNHQFDIIEYCSEEELNCSERFWQDEFDVLSRNGLNCVLTKCGGVKRVLSEESRDKIRVSKLGNLNPNFGKKASAYTTNLRVEQMKGEKHYLFGKSQSQESIEKQKATKLKNKIGHRGSNPKAKIVLCTETGIFYDCAMDAADAYQISYSNLKDILNPNNDNRINNTSLIYVDNYIEGVPIKKRNAIRVNSKKVIDISTSIEYKSIREAANSININYSTLKDKLNGNLKNNTTLKFL